MSLESLFSLRGKTALVAGASRGIGLAIAKEIAAAGAHTILAARSMDKLEERAAELRTAGYSAEAKKLDTADSATIQALAADVGSKVDILINVSGMNIRKRFEEFTKEEYHKILDTNLHGIVELTQAIGKQMVARGAGGKIVNIGSLMSLRGLPYLVPYAISKSGLAGLTRVLAAEWGRYGIQVNCIAPGFIITDLNREMWKPDFMMDWLKGIQGNPKAGTPEDIAGMAVFLSGPGSNYVTGLTIPVDGGFSTTSVWPFEP